MKKTNKKPFISFIIPTRNRCEYLKHTILTCLNQTSKDYEVIISDNQSSDQTEKIVKKLNSKKIIYKKTKKYISMTENWEYACRFANGKYIIFLGDDDGVFPNLTKMALKYLKQKRYEILTWDTPIFVWPMKKNENGYFFRYPKFTKNKIVNLRNICFNIIKRGGLGLSELPMIYHSLFSRNLLNRIKRTTGAYFLSKSPDVFSGFSAANQIETCLKIGIPLSIHGWSAQSNSGSMIYEYGGNINQKYLSAFNRKIKTLPYYHDRQLNFFNSSIETIKTGILKNKKIFSHCHVNIGASFAFFNRMCGFKKTKWLIFDIFQKNRYKKLIPSFLKYSILNIIILLLKKQEIIVNKYFLKKTYYKNVKDIPSAITAILKNSQI